MWDIKEQATNEQVIQINKNQSHRYRKQNGGCQREEGLRNWMKNVKGLRSTNW